MRKHLNRCLCIVRCVKSKAPGRDESLPYESTEKGGAAVSCGPHICGPTGRPQQGYGVGLRAGRARPLHGVSMGKWDIIIGLRRRINVVGVEFPGVFLLVMTNSFR